MVFLKDNTDLLVFSGVALLIAALFHRFLWTKTTVKVIWMGWAILIVLILSSWFFTYLATQKVKTQTRTMVEGFAATYARELELMDHESIGPDTDPADPRYLQMIEAEVRWLEVNPYVADIYTLRYLPNGKLGFMVDSETDYNRDGKIEGAREERTQIGEEFSDASNSVALAKQTGKPQFDDVESEDRWGKWISTSVPLRGKDGRVDAILGVDIAAEDWLRQISYARYTTMAYFALLLVIVGVGSNVLAHQDAVRNYLTEQRQQSGVRVEKKKLETLVNSIEGIVWECPADSYHFTYISKQSERILGYTPEEWLADPDFWPTKLHMDDLWVIEKTTELVALKEPYAVDYRLIAADGRTVWIRESAAVLIDENGEPVTVRGVFLDITEQTTAAEKLDSLNRRLLETSRHAGMAEVATSVLHNVGNVLNSISVSATIAGDTLRRSRAKNLHQAATMLKDKSDTLADFITHDPKGKLIPDYLFAGTEQLIAEQEEMIGEITSLSQNIEHIKEIVAMQQSYASVSGVFEQLDPVDLVEDALRMNSAAVERHRVKIARAFEAGLPTVNVDRHKVLQILINLIRNAKYAMDAKKATGKTLTVTIESIPGEMIAIRVKDNGEGISPENLTRIFQHGFTTKKEGHGFGLHSGANAAKEMGGVLSVASEGKGFGAEFTLTLPVCKYLSPTPA